MPGISEAGKETRRGGETRERVLLVVVSERCISPCETARNVYDLPLTQGAKHCLEPGLLEEEDKGERHKKDGEQKQVQEETGRGKIKQEKEKEKL